MKTLQEIKEMVANKNGYNSWEILMERRGIEEHYLNQVAKKYAEEAINQCAEDIGNGLPDMGFTYQEKVILNVKSKLE